MVNNNNNNKMDFQKIAFEDVYWIRLAQDRDWWQALVNRLINLRLP
jgi:hypothetical protein